MLQYSPKIVTDSLVMCLDASQNKSYPTTDLPVKGGLVMWMDAADDTTFSYSSGTTVSQWRDKSGFNYHMVPVSAGPTRNAFLNSRKVLAFTTSQDIQNLTIDLRTSAYTIFVVDRYTNAASGTQRILTANPGNAGSNWLLGHWGGSADRYYAEGWVYASGTFTDVIWRLYMGDWSSATTDLANFYNNGTSLASNSTNASGGPYSLGINANSGERSNCEAAEIIVFNRVLSAVERRLVHTYLGQKWGISNTDRSIIDLSNNNIASFGGAAGSQTVANMPTFDFYNKGALRFDGTDDYVVGTVPSIAASSTVGMWIKSSNYGSKIPFSIAGSTYGSGPNIFFFSGLINWNTGDGAGNPFSNSSYLDSNWHYMVVTNDAATNAKLYIDGVLIGTAAYRNTISTNSNNLWLGRFSGNNDYTINGNIAGTQIYNKALSAAEVAQNYEAQKSKFANTIVQSGLVLNLDAGNPYSYAGAGTTWYDVSGNSFNATLNNSPTYTTDNGGVLNWISASSQYATVSMSSTLRVANITQEAWVYLSTTADQVFIGSQYGTGSNNSFALWVSGGTFYFGVNVGGTFYQSASSAPSTSTWYHLVHTYNGTTQYLYINGILVTTYNSAASGNMTYDTSNTLLAIGADFNGTGYNVGPSLYVNGKMPVIRIYNTALSAAQVLQNYNATKGRFGL